MIQIETLESRTLFSVYIVNTTADTTAVDTLLSLREAVTAANLNTAIGDAPAGTEEDFIYFDPSLRGQTIVLGGTQLMITDRLVIDGQNNNITIDAAGASRAFYIETPETVWLSNLTLANGFSTGNGGSVILRGGGTTVLDGMTVRDSFVFGGEMGGAIFNRNQTLHLRNSSLYGNSIANGSGGAVAAESTSVNVIYHTLISDNSAQIFGGGVYNLGDMTIDRSTVFANAAYGNAGGGGGIANFGSLLLSGSLVQHNSSLGGNDGGGLVNLGGVTQVAATRIEDNGAYGGAGGGGIMLEAGTVNLYDTTVKRNNGATGNGGGIAMGSGTLIVTHAEISDNAAAQGGGLEVTAGFADIVDANFSRNQATGSFGGAIDNAGGTVWLTDVFVRNNRAAGEGGGIASAGVLDIRDADISNNRSALAGGGVIADGTLSIDNSLIYSNTAGSSGAVGGGGVAAFAPSIITNTSIFSNTTTGRGGGIFNDSAMTLDDLDVTSNSASDGGGIYADLNGNATLSGFDSWDFRWNWPNNYAGFVLA